MTQNWENSYKRSSWKIDFSDTLYNIFDKLHLSCYHTLKDHLLYFVHFIQIKKKRNGEFFSSIFSS